MPPLKPEGGLYVMNKYLVRLLVFSLLLGALPTVFVGFASYYISSRDIEKKVNEGNMQLLTQTQMRVEQTLESLERSATQLVNSQLVKTALSQPLSGEDFVLVRKLMAELSNMQTDALIQQAYLIDLNHDWSVDFGVLKPFSLLSEHQRFTNYAKQDASLSWSTNVVMSVASDEGSVEEGAAAKPVQSIDLVYKIPLLPRASDRKGLLVVRISAAELKGALAPHNHLGNHYILDKQGKSFIGATRDRPIDAGIRDKIAAMKATGERSGMFQTAGGLAVQYRSSSYNGWTYMSMVSVGELREQPRKIAMLTIAACSLILLVVFATAFFGSWRMYRPIRSLLHYTKSMVPASSSTGGSAAVDELAYIRDSLQSMAVMRSKLEKQMEGQAGQLKQFFVLKLFAGQHTELANHDRWRMYGFPTDWHKLAVLTLQIDTLQNTRYQERDRELLLFAINNMVGELVPERERFSPITLEQAQTTLLTLDEEDEERIKERLYETAERIKCSVEQYLQLKVSIGISRPFDKLAGTMEAYGESVAALNNRISLGADIIIHYEDVRADRSGGTTVYSHLRPLEDAMVQALKEGDLDKAMERFHVYLAIILQKESYAQEHRILLMQLLSRILQIVQDQGISVKQVLMSEGAIERFYKLQTKEEIVIWYQTRLFAPIARLQSERTDSHYISMAEKLVEMIHARYDQDISLEMLATELSFHPVYVSRVFKREVGVPFSDYLAEYRMTAAKKLLESTSLKIAEIGEKLQYKNNSAFIRTFKKKYEMTPGQYRELLDVANRAASQS